MEASADLRREHFFIARPRLGQKRVNLAEDLLRLDRHGLPLCGDLTSELDSVAANDGLAHAGAVVKACDLGHSGLLRPGWFLVGVQGGRRLFVVKCHRCKTRKNLDPDWITYK